MLEELNCLNDLRNQNPTTVSRCDYGLLTLPCRDSHRVMGKMP